MRVTPKWWFFADFVRLYILFHAARNPVSARELGRELDDRGYRLSMRKLDRVLTSLEQAGYLTAFAGQASNMGLKCYQATAKGRDFVVLGKAKLQALAGEIFPANRRDREEHDPMDDSRESEFGLGE